MKYTWRKNDKQFYLPKSKPELIAIPNFKFVTIRGIGNPNNKEFSENVGALYKMSYSIKMLPKKGIIPDEYFDYTVFPLEGIWSMNYAPDKNQPIDKDKLIYKIMIRQPDFVTKEVFEKALSIINEKDDNPIYDLLKLEEIKDGECVQIMHVGAFANEQASFDIIDFFRNY